MSGYNPYAPPSYEQPAAAMPQPHYGQQNYSMPAGFWIRVVAAIVDGLVLLPVSILSFVNFLMWKSVLVQLLITIPGLLYKPLMESRVGATLGKKAVGIVVITENGQFMSTAQSYLRYSPWLLTTLVASINTLMIFGDSSFAHVTDFMDMSTVEQPLQVPMQLINMAFLASCLTAAFTAQKRALHDYLAKTFVIYKPG